MRENGKLRKATWPEALGKAAEAIKGAKSLAGLVGDLAPVEATFALKQLIEGQGGIVECRTDGAKLPSGNRAAYAGTATIDDIDHAEGIMMIGTNPRLEAPVLNARIRKAWTQGAYVAMVGDKVDLTYDAEHIGSDATILNELMKRDHTEIAAKRSVIIVGMGALTRADGAAILAAAQSLAEATKSGLMILHTAASRVGAMDVGATNADSMAAIDKADVIYNLGADELEIK